LPPRLTTPRGTNPRSVAAGDFNADNRPDLAVANLNNSVVSVLLNTLTARLNIT